MKRIIAVFVTMIAVTSPLFATPDHALTTNYYDGYGNIIGAQYLLCGYPWDSSWGDVSGDNYCTEIGDACEGSMGTLSCQDMGMGTISECANGFCYSDGYMLSYYLGVQGCY